jgi:hypothetical protein
MAYTAMWRSGVVMDTGTLDTDIVADIVATMDILMGVITGEGTIIHTTGLITEAIMATHMVVAITAGAEDSGSASASKF